MYKWVKDLLRAVRGVKSLEVPQRGFNLYLKPGVSRDVVEELQRILSFGFPLSFECLVWKLYQDGDQMVLRGEPLGEFTPDMQEDYDFFLTDLKQIFEDRLDEKTVS